MIQKIPLRRGGGRTKSTQDATTSRFRDEPERDNKTRTYHIRQSEKKHQPSFKFDEENKSSSIEVSSKDKSNESSSSSLNMESEKWDVANPKNKPEQKKVM